MPGYKSIICILSVILLTFADKNMTIDLQWLPSTDIDKIDEIDFSKILNHTFFLDVIDKRTTGNEIGRNEEDKDKGLIKKVFTKSDITSFIKTNTNKCLSKYAIELSGKESADITIQLEVLDYYVLEESTYKGMLKTKVTLLSKEGNSLVKTLTVGESKPWGKSFSKDNYLNALSNCIIENTSAILSNKEVQNALNEMK